MNMTTATNRLSKLVLRTSLALPLVMAPAVSVTVLEAVGVSTTFASAQAQSNQQTRRVPSMREAVGKALAKAQEAAEAENWNGALAALREMEGRASTYNEYEAAMMHYYYGFVYYSMDRHRDAINSYKRVLQAKNSIPESLEVGTLLTIGQLYFAIEDYKQSINYLNQWFAASEQVTAENYAMRGQVYYSMGDHNKALSDLNTAVSMSEKEGQVPRENWYSLQRFLYYEKNDYRNVAGVLEKMVKHYPKGEYYIQLSGIYGELKRDADQLHMMEAAYIAGALNRERELLNMAYLFMGNEMPYKAAKVLDKGIKDKKVERNSKNLETLAQAYQQARELEKTIPNLEAAAKLSDKGELYARLAGIYLDLDRNEQAVTMGNLALKKGGLKRPDQTHIVLGMANANLKKYEAALKSLAEAKKDKRSERFAVQWISYVENEQKREKQLQI